jgi:hypothetical protein
MNMKDHRRIERTLLLSLLGVLCGPTAVAGDECLTVAVRERVELPDGSIHDAGRLTLCSGVALSPVTQLLRLSMNGSPIGFVMSRPGRAEAPTHAQPTFLFHRRASGALGLASYQVPDARGSRTYLILPIRSVPGVRRVGMAGTGEARDDVAVASIPARARAGD